MKQQKPGRVRPREAKSVRSEAVDIEFVAGELRAARARELKLLTMLETAENLIKTLTLGILELKKAGYTPDAPKPEKKKAQPPPKTDEQIVRERDVAAIDRMAKDFEKQGASPADARKEATRIREESTRTTLHPDNAR